MRDKSHMCGSARHSSICETLKVLFSMPVLLERRRSIDMNFSDGDRKRAFIGLSGKNSMTQTPMTMVMRPKRRNMICHELKVVVLTCWKPKDDRAPMMVPIPVPRYQVPMRVGCSLFLYHMPLMRIRLGATADSKTPSRTRTATSAAYDLHAQCIVTQIPHNMTISPRYFAVGNRCMR